MANSKTQRNYKGEREWMKYNYKRFEAKLEKTLGEEFAQFLKTNNTSFTDWVRDSYDTQLRAQMREEKRLQRKREKESQLNG